MARDSGSRLISLTEKTERVLEHGFWIPRPGAFALIKTLRSYVAFLIDPRILWGYLFFILLGIFKPWLRHQSKPAQETKSGLPHPNAFLLLWFLCTNPKRIVGADGVRLLSQIQNA